MSASQNIHRPAIPCYLFVSSFLSLSENAAIMPSVCKQTNEASHRAIRALTRVTIIGDKHKNMRTLLDNIMKRCLALRELTLLGNWEFSCSADEALYELIPRPRGAKLESISLIGCTNIGNRGLDYLAQIPTLTALSLDHCNTYLNLGVLKEAPLKTLTFINGNSPTGLPKTLEKLVLQSVYMMPEKELMRAIRELTNLQILDLTGTTIIPYPGAQTYFLLNRAITARLLTANPNLKIIGNVEA